MDTESCSLFFFPHLVFHFQGWPTWQAVTAPGSAWSLPPGNGNSQWRAIGGCLWAALSADWSLLSDRAPRRNQVSQMSSSAFLLLPHFSLCVPSPVWGRGEGRELTPGSKCTVWLPAQISLWKWAERTNPLSKRMWESIAFKAWNDTWGQRQLLAMHPIFTGIFVPYYIHVWGSCTGALLAPHQRAQCNQSSWFFCPMGLGYHLNHLFVSKFILQIKTTHCHTRKF